jgi:hypothetical protein
MKSIALLCLLALSSTAAAESATINTVAVAIDKADAPQATVDFELLETKNKRTSLLASGGIEVDIYDKAQEKAIFKNFSEGFGSEAQGIIVVREQTYVQQVTTKTVFNEAGLAIEKTELTPGVVAEGVRVQAVMAQPEGQELTGKLFMDLRKIKNLRNYTHDGKTIQLPEVVATSFDVTLKEGESTHKFGNYTIKTKVKIDKMP